MVLIVTLRRRRNAPEEAALGTEDRRVVERVLGPRIGQDGEPK
jgi:hypothetical protein